MCSSEVNAPYQKVRPPMTDCQTRSMYILCSKKVSRPPDKTLLMRFKDIRESKKEEIALMV